MDEISIFNEGDALQYRADLSSNPQYCQIWESKERIVAVSDKALIAFSFVDMNIQMIKYNEDYEIVHSIEIPHNRLIGYRVVDPWENVEDIIQLTEEEKEKFRNEAHTLRVEVAIEKGHPPLFHAPMSNMVVAPKEFLLIIEKYLNSEDAINRKNRNFVF